MNLGSAWRGGALAAALAATLTGCTAEDRQPEIQARIDAAHAAGGGVVMLEAGVHPIGQTLLLRSGVHLVGAGAGATVVRPLRRDLEGLVVEGAAINAVIGMVAVDNVSVRALTLDLAHQSVVDNGIAILPAGAKYRGRPSRDVTIRNVEVRARPTRHSYLIWNLRGERVRIVDNRVDGGVLAPDADSQQEGIESYGGRDVAVIDNFVGNVGNACLNFGSAGGPGTDTQRLVVRGNVLIGCRRGVHAGSAFDAEFGPQSPAGLLISGNVIENVWEAGVSLRANPGTTLRDVVVRGNLIRTVGVAGGPGAAGVLLQGAPRQPGVASASVVIDDNTISDVRGKQGHGVRVIDLDGADVRDNRITDVEHSGIFLLQAPEAVLIGNRIDGAGYSAVTIGAGSPHATVRSNVATDWGRRAWAPPLFAASPNPGQIDGNHFFCRHADPDVALVDDPDWSRACPTRPVPEVAPEAADDVPPPPATPAGGADASNSATNTKAQ